MKKELTLDEKYYILLNAALKMAKMLRENPPGVSQTTIPFDIYVALIANGYNDDPEGYRFLNYFLNEAQKEIEKGKNNVEH